LTKVLGQALGDFESRNSAGRLGSTPKAAPFGQGKEPISEGAQMVKRLGRQIFALPEDAFDSCDGDVLSYLVLYI
jgi:hypothetical protein